MKRLLTIQDISCVGKCSLTVALPIISAFGIETAVLPTAVLSTHTAFSNFTFHDLTDEIEPVYKTWKKENIGFDCVYTGYLGSKKQIQLVKDIFTNFKTENNFFVVDPAMADHGKLYKGFDNDFALNMAGLCAKADVIVPNLTEACFMLNKPYIDSGYNEDYIKDILSSLCDLGCNTAVLTGVSFNENQLGVYAFNKMENKYYEYYRDKLPFMFHGTGDVFASSLAGSLSLGIDLQKSLHIAVDFTWESIDNTIKNPNHNWYGVEFESAFPSLLNMIKK